MHIHQQNHWNDILFYWYQSYHWYQWTISLTNRIRLCILDMCASKGGSHYIVGIFIPFSNFYYFPTISIFSFFFSELTGKGSSFHIVCNNVFCHGLVVFITYYDTSFLPLSCLVLHFPRVGQHHYSNDACGVLFARTFTGPVTISPLK